MKAKKGVIEMEVMNPNAAGIDIGSRSHWVAIGQNSDQIREFGVYNEDLAAIATWLKDNGIESVAMESTGTPSRGLIGKPCMHFYKLKDLVLFFAMVNLQRILRGVKLTFRTVHGFKGYIVWGFLQAVFCLMKLLNKFALIAATGQD
jgi:hypothetical protein